MENVEKFNFMRFFELFFHVFLSGIIVAIVAMATFLPYCGIYVTHCGTYITVSLQCMNIRVEEHCNDYAAVSTRIL